jgi:ubiquinone/menaquinone biosynthesis C-methylase UbiE
MRPIRHAFICMVSALALVATTAAGQLRSSPAEEWIVRLENPERLEGLRIPEVVQHLGLKPGDVVADLGAGAGAFLVDLSRAVGPTGKVYAVEIDRGFIDYMSRKVDEHQLTNVTAILGAFTDPALPAKDVDVAMLHDVLHHIEHRAEYIRNLAAYMKRNGRIAVIELPADGPHRDEPELIVSREQVAGWMAAAGFTPAEEYHFLGDKWYVVYERKQ